MKSHLKQLNEALGTEPLDVKYQTVQAFFTQLSLTHSPKSVRNVYATYHNVMAAALREELVTKIHKVTLPKAKRAEQDWLSVEDMKRIIHDARPSHQPLYALLAETGLRIGEALGLQVKDLNAGTLKVERSVYNGVVQAPKTPSAYRTLTLSAYLVDFLKKLATGRPADSFLFQSSVGTVLWPDKVLSRDLHPLLRDLKINLMGFHSFRRGNATLMCSELGVPEKVAAYRLGHQAPGLTLGVYAQSWVGIDKDFAPRIGGTLFEC